MNVNIGGQFIIVGIIILVILVFLFWRKIKKVWFKIPFFEGGVELDTDQITPSENKVKSQATTSKIISDHQDNESKLNQDVIRRDQLRKITPIETGKLIKDLPQNIYGYAHAYDIHSAISSNHGNFRITNLQKTNWYYEVRKGEDNIYLVGYVSQEGLSNIGRETYDVTIFAQPWEDFKILVTISFSKILESSSRTIDDNYGDIMILELKVTR